LPAKEQERIKMLLHERYADFKPTFASEKLRENHYLDHDPKTIRQIMINEGLWQPKRKEKISVHRAWRERRSHYGEMIQFDGSYEHWLEDRAGTGELCLLAAIDDATGKIVAARFAEHEGVFPVFGFWQEYLFLRGKPMAIYTDKFSTYKMNQKQAMENHDQKTQFQRATSELQIEAIFAESPQAKGRVERLFGVLQDRLIKELRLAKIKRQRRRPNRDGGRFCAERCCGAGQRGTGCLAVLRACAGTFTAFANAVSTDRRRLAFLDYRRHIICCSAGICISTRAGLMNVSAWAPCSA